MTTNTTNSQDRPMNLGELLDAYKAAILNGTGSTAQRGAIEDHFAFELGIAKAAYGAEKARATAAESRAEKAEQYAQVALGIKDSLEGRLAEIQRGVEGLQGYDKARILVVYADVLALLQPQGQAATTMMRTELPQGWKLVPVEPTEEMMDSCRGGFITALAMPAFVAAYKTMVESAPQTLQTKDGLYALDNLSTKADDEGKIINDTSGLPG